MSNTSLINDKGYVQSKNIKVFPCAYRGYYSETLDDNGNKIYQIINPEARTTSEYSFVNSYHKLSANKESYVISWTPETQEGSYDGELKFVIGGYYFEISNCALTDFIDSSTKTPKTFYIKVKTSGENPGQYLGSFNESDKWLDTNTGNIKENKLDDYYFTGLKIVSGNISGINTYSLTPFASQFKQWKVTTQSTEGENSLSNILTIINSLPTTEKALIYYTDDEVSTPASFNNIINPTVSSFEGTVIFYKQVFDISAMALPITNLLDSGSGKYSLRMLSDIEADEQTTNTTIASGDYSVALGRRTKAEGIVSTALGDRNTVTGKAALAIGSNNLAQGNNSFTIGEQTQAKGNNSATFGNKTEASNNNTIAGGYNSRAQGENSFAFGENVIAKGKNAIAIGYKTTTTEAWAEGENSITLGSDTKTTSDADNAIAAGNATEASGINSLAIGNGCKAKGNNSFAGGAGSEANNENSFAFGNNVKTNANNQVVFGKYNLEDNTKAFIIANGADEDTKSNKFTVSYNGDVKALGIATIEGETTINNNLIVKGNITADKADSNNTAANNLYLGNSSSASGTLSIYGSGANKVFYVTNEGVTTIAGSTSITKDDDYDSTNNTAALTVTGGAHIGKKLNVADSITAKDAITVNKTNATNTLILGSTTDTSSKGAIDVYGNGTTKVFSVTDTGNTSIAGTANISGTVTITEDDDYIYTTNTNTHSAALKVDGGVHIGKKLNVLQATTIGGNLTATGGTTSLATTNISGVTNITNTTEYLSSTTGEGTNAVTTYSAALKVAGGVHIGKKLNVIDNTTIGGTLTATGSTTLNNNLNVAGDLVTTDITKKVKLGNGISGSSDFVQINGTATIAGALTTKSDLFVNGSLKLNGTETASTFELLNTDSVTKVKLSSTEALLPETEIDGDLTCNSLTAEDTTIGSVRITAGDITGVSNLTATGLIQALAFNATSDLRKKTNIKDYKCEKSILDLPIKSFEYINDESHTKYIGCIAQDLQEICPEIISTDKEGYLSIQESKLIYLLLQEVKELKEKVEKLERR